MEHTIVSIADAKARLSELADLAASGETIVVTRRGKPVLQLSKPEAERQPVDLTALRRLSASLPPQSEEAGDFMRRVRDEARY